MEFDEDFSPEHYSWSPSLSEAVNKLNHIENEHIRCQIALSTGALLLNQEDDVAKGSASGSPAEPVFLPCAAAQIKTKSLSLANESDGAIRAISPKLSRQRPPAALRAALHGALDRLREGCSPMEVAGALITVASAMTDSATACSTDDSLLTTPAPVRPSELPSSVLGLSSHDRTQSTNSVLSVSDDTCNATNCCDGLNGSDGSVRVAPSTSLSLQTQTPLQANSSLSPYIGGRPPPQLNRAEAAHCVMIHSQSPGIPCAAPISKDSSSALSIGPCPQNQGISVDCPSPGASKSCMTQAVVSIPSAASRKPLSSLPNADLLGNSRVGSQSHKSTLSKSMHTATVLSASLGKNRALQTAEPTPQHFNSVAQFMAARTAARNGSKQ